jgi:hypothetical protein
MTQGYRRHWRTGRKNRGGCGSCATNLFGTHPRNGRNAGNLITALTTHPFEGELFSLLLLRS